MAAAFQARHFRSECPNEQCELHGTTDLFGHKWCTACGREVLIICRATGQCQLYRNIHRHFDECTKCSKALLEADRAELKAHLQSGGQRELRGAGTSGESAVGASQVGLCG
jgi:hypothetical protein